MEQESQKRKLEDSSVSDSSSETPLCLNNCGFFGNPSSNNLCSKCYKDYLLKQAKDSINSDKKFNKTLELIDQTVDELSTQAQEPPQEANPIEGSSSENPEKRPANRCNFCKKRVGLTGFKCRCGDMFCSMHRYSDKHDCVFNYKSAGRDAIAKANPVVKADKVEKI